jgi:CRP-like cAMP-binding protein
MRRARPVVRPAEPSTRLGEVTLGRLDLEPERHVQRGETILAQGSPSAAMFVVRGGLLRESAVSPDGRWLVHGLLGRGEVFGSLTPNGASQTAVRAARPSRVTTISATRFDALLMRRPELAWSLLSRIENRIARAERLAQELVWCDVGARVQRRLRELADQHGRSVPGGVRIEILLTQEDLAAMVGAARETVNRVIVGLIAAGMVRVERRRYILQEPFLHKETEGHGGFEP